MSDRGADGPVRGTEAAAETSMYELFIAILTLISLVNMVLLYFLRILFPDSPNVSILFAMDTIYCVFFLVDVSRNLIRAESKRDYLFWRGALEFFGSIPALPALRIARVGRLIRVSHLIRKDGAKRLGRQFIERRAEGAL